MHLTPRMSFLDCVRIVSESMMYSNTIRSYLRLRLLYYFLFAFKHVMPIISTYPSTYIIMVCQS